MLDRLAHLVNTVQDLLACGVGLRVLAGARAAQVRHHEGWLEHLDAARRTRAAANVDATPRAPSWPPAAGGPGGAPGALLSETWGLPPGCWTASADVGGAAVVLERSADSTSLTGVEAVPAPGLDVTGPDAG